MENIKHRLTIILLLFIRMSCQTWSIVLREEHTLRAFKNAVLKEMSGPKNEEVTRGYRKPYTEWTINCHISTVWSGNTHTHYMTILYSSRVVFWKIKLLRKIITFCWPNSYFCWNRINGNADFSKVGRPPILREHHSFLLGILRWLQCGEWLLAVMITGLCTNRLLSVDVS